MNNKICGEEEKWRKEEMTQKGEEKKKLGEEGRRERELGG